MILGGNVPAHLTYCTNIHPGESWTEVRHNLEAHVVRVKKLLVPDQPFGVGLRLSAEAGRRLAEPAALEELRGFLADQGLYVFTINGFPCGRFHGARVKEHVYRPDWREEDRLVYSDQLAHILAALLPPALDGSVSTVPGCFKPRARGPAAVAEIADRLIRHAATLLRIERETGRRIVLALEPEPHCLIETVAETVAFFEEHLVSRAAGQRLAELAGLSQADAEAAIRVHLGVCLDACHAAVEFEEAGAAVAALRRAGIGIAKVQISAGLRVVPPSTANRAALLPFAEDVYLHQVVARRGAELRRYADLQDALDDERAEADEEWRIHFHVPLFREELGPFRNTQGFLRELLALQAREAFCSHFEVETYTWHVLPSEYRGEDVVEDVVREMRWALAALDPGPPA